MFNEFKLMSSNESNAAKSTAGNKFNKYVADLLDDLKLKNKIKEFEKEPRYNHPTKKFPQFSPDGEITLLSDKIIVYDNTTTVRHDRLKQKLWDAYGTKENFQAKGIKIEYFVVVPNELSIKETKNYEKERKKITASEYFSTVDDIITVSALMEKLQ